MEDFNYYTFEFTTAPNRFGNHETKRITVYALSEEAGALKALAKARRYRWKATMKMKAVKKQ